MKHSTKVYCSSIIKNLIPAAKAYEDKVVSIATKFGKDLAKIEQTAEEMYAPSGSQNNGVMSYFDSQARKKAEEEKQAELKILNDRRKVYIDSKKEGLVPAAREQIRTAQKEFQNEAAKVAKDLRKHLEDDVSTPLNTGFLHFARVFNEFGISLTDLDCTALMDLSEDNPLAYRVIQSIIDKTGSPYTFTGKDTLSYAEDIRTIENMAKDDCFCVPQSVFHEMNQLFVGSPVYLKTAESMEEKLETNFNATFDTTGLTISSGSFTHGVEKLSEISESWSADAKVEYDAAKAYAKEKAQRTAGTQASMETLGAYMK